MGQEPIAPAEVGAITTTTSEGVWRPDLDTFTPEDTLPEALILQCSTVAGTIEGDAPSVRVGYVDDSANETDFVAEDDEIEETVPALAQATVYTAKLARLVRLSREQWLSQNASNRVADAVAASVQQRADLAFLQEDAPVAPALAPPAGLAELANIETASAAVSGDLDNLIELVATLEANGAQPSHIVLDPKAWSAIRKFKTADGSNESLVGAGTADAVRTLLGIPLIISNAVPEMTGLVIDRRAIVSAVGPVAVAHSEHAYFGRDSIAIRVTWRIGWTAVRPDRIGSFTVAEPSAGNGEG